MVGLVSDAHVGDGRRLETSRQCHVFGIKEQRVRSRREKYVVGDITRTAYSVSKAAIIGLTRQVATHYGQQGIRCNAVAPGLVLSPGTRGAAADVIAVMQRHLLTPEVGLPDDIAALVCFLASAEARYINGQTYIADGGMVAHNPAMADLIDYVAQRR